MKYMGSKNRIAKHILPIMLKAANEAGIKKWVEPFVGGGNMIDKVPPGFMRYGYDLNEHVIMAMVDIRDNVNILPALVTEKEYKLMKGSESQKITSWVRFVCSLGGKFENGFARDRKGIPPRNFASEGIRNAQKQFPNIQGVEFIHADYRTLSFTDSLIYCDPPYQGTTGYKTGSFNHDEFFDWCRDQAKSNIVFVSEYEAPFECVWQGEIKTNFSSTRKSATHRAVEKLFIVC